MVISKKRIMNADTYLANVTQLSKFRLVADVTDLSLTKLTRVGFPEPVTPGQMVLPTAIGPVSRFNANGNWNVRRDLEKESRYIRTVYWTRKEWAGRGQTVEVSDYRDIFMDCYPRDFIEPPALELQYQENGARKLIVSPEFTNDPDDRGAHKHAINLFLELFGTCEVVTSDLKRLTPTPVRRVNWKLLPQGDRPWPVLQQHLQGTLGRSAASTQQVILDRQKTIYGYVPDEIAVGVGGFDDYLAYIFKDRGLVVLESIRKDNAIYIFGDDWQAFSQLSKAEVLASSVHLHRVIHSDGWKDTLRQIMSGPKIVMPAAPKGSAPSGDAAQTPAHHKKEIV